MAWTDIEALSRLEAVLFPGEAWTSATWWAELAERPRREYVVADDSRAGDPGAVDPPQVAGYAGISHAGTVADIMTLAVAPAYQRCGLGERLVSELLRRAAQRGAASVLLEVRADNHAALRLYERRGFERVAVRRRYYQPDDVDAYVLRLRLREP